MRSVLRFLVIILGLALLLVGGLQLYLAIVAELVGIQAFKSIDNVALGLVGFVIAFAGRGFVYHAIEADLLESN